MLVMQAIVTQNIAEGNVFMGVVTRILALLKKFDTFTLYHIKREFNSVADHDAKEAPQRRDHRD